MDNEKEKKEDKEKETEKREEVVMMACCAEGEGIEIAEKVGEKVLIKLGKRLEGRSNVVMTRLNDEDLKQIDALVEIEVFRSRSEATCFFIKEGIQAKKDLFRKVMPTVEKIRELKEQAKNSLSQGKTQ